MKLETQITFRCPRFKPTPGELDEKSDEYINDGVFGNQAASFLAERLAQNGFAVRAITREDWGCWVQLENPEKYFLAVGIANYDDVDGYGDEQFPAFEGETHRLFIEPSESPIRKWFKKINTEERVTRLFSQVRQILEADDGITNIVVGED